MKQLLYLFLFTSTLFSCNKGVRERNKFLGNWEMTEYVTDGVLIDQEEAFTSTSIEIKHPGSLSSHTSFVYRNQKPCNHDYPIGFTFSETAINFGEFSICDTLNKIDPYFYKANGTANNIVSGKWNIEYHDKRMLIINNNNQSKKGNSTNYI